MSDPLSSDKLREKLPSCLPDSAQLYNAAAALAALCHTIHVALDFRLTSSLPSFEAGQTDFTFKYRHPQSAMEFEVKVGKLGGRAVINAIAVEDSKTKTMDLLLADYFSTSAFSSPVSPADFTTCFNSPARLQDLIADYRRTVLQPLVPGLQKEGYTEEAAAARNAAASGNEGPPQGGRGGFYPDPGGPLPYANPPPVQPARAGPSNPFPPIGAGDREPLGGLGGTTGGRVPLGGLEGDGMMVGPDHPLFRDRMRNDDDPLRLPGRGGQPQTGPWGGDGFLPPMGAPPGARFDPIGPGAGIPGRGRGSGPGGPPGFPRPPGGGFGSGFGGGGSGEPDNDEFQPPRDEGYDSMFG